MLLPNLVLRQFVSTQNGREKLSFRPDLVPHFQNSGSKSNHVALVQSRNYQFSTINYQLSFHNDLVVKNS